MEVEFFPSAEEAMQALQRAMKAADARVRPWQAAVQVGDCFVSDGGDGLLVFGEVLESYQEERLRHYRFCRCFSVACPEGELGDVHVSTMLCVVSRRFFEETQRRGWEAEGWPFREPADPPPGEPRPEAGRASPSAPWGHADGLGLLSC